MNHEGFRDRVYLDDANKFTIGYGHKITDAEMLAKMFLDPITKEEGLTLFSADLARVAPYMTNEYVRVALSQNQVDALASFIYNVGGPNFVNSELRKQLNMGAFPAATFEFGRWVNADGQLNSGLVRRRSDEATLFNEK
jgi:lysozyme